MNQKDIIRKLSDYNFEVKGYQTEIIKEESYLIVRLYSKSDKKLINYSFVLYENVLESGFVCYLKVKDVEEIITPIMKKSDFHSLTDGEYMITSSFHQLESVKEQEVNDKLGLPFEIKDESDIKCLLITFKDFVLNYAEPFFDKWSDLRVLNDFFDELPQKEVGQYFGQGGIFKKAVVYKLCNNPKYEEYFDWLYNGLVKGWEQDPSQDIIWKQFADAVIALKEVLDKTAPIYNVES